MRIPFLLAMVLASLSWAAQPKDTTELKSLLGSVVLRASASPYVVHKSLVQPTSGVLKIEPGVVVLMDGYAKLHLRGSVKISGTVRKPVRMVALDSSADWIGLHVATGERPVEIQSLVVRNAFRNMFEGVQGNISKSFFEDNYYGTWVEESPKLLWQECSWSGNRYGFSVGSDSVWVEQSNWNGNVIALWLEHGSGWKGEKNSWKDNQQDISDQSSPDRKTASGRYAKDALQAIEAGF